MDRIDLHMKSFNI